MDATAGAGDGGSAGGAHPRFDAHHRGPLTVADFAERHAVHRLAAQLARTAALGLVVPDQVLVVVDPPSYRGGTKEKQLLLGVWESSPE